MKASGFAFRLELGGLLKLSLPIMFTQFIQVSNTTVAILMMGRVGSVELAALGLGGSFMIFVFLVCLGIPLNGDLWSPLRGIAGVFYLAWSRSFEVILFVFSSLF